MLSPPESEADLLARCRRVVGWSVAQLAHELKLVIPTNPLQCKGFLGKALEIALGADAGSRSQPDFSGLGIELKTLPLLASGKPAESTFVTTIPLLRVHQQTWETSQCFAKLRRVLWFPVEGDVRVPFLHRRLGEARLWSPSIEDLAVLERDWSELTCLISMGRLADVDARMGDYLQVRPKAANARSLCYGFDEEGRKILTLPRGFYLRSTFTATILG